MMINKFRRNTHSWVITGLLLFLLALGGTRIIAAASPLSAPIITILAGVILMGLTFAISQQITRHPVHAATSTCPACNQNHKPEQFFCLVCGRELKPASTINAITSTPRPSRWLGLSLRSPVVVILLVFLSLILIGVGGFSLSY